MIQTIKLENFTTFKKIELNLSPGINVLIGENGTGKSHLLKAVYALCSPTDFKNDQEPIELLKNRLLSIFKPEAKQLSELNRKGSGEDTKLFVKAQESSTEKSIHLSFDPTSNTLKSENESPLELMNKIPVFFPTKEVLSFFKGFVSLYDHRNLPFDETYRDICQALDLPEVREERLEEEAKSAIENIEKVCGGKFIFRGGTITFKQSNAEESSINLVAEGFRKLGMLSRLLETQAIDPGKSGALFFDEPEANMNPKLLKLLIEILLDLSRKGQQIILATHDYVLLKELDLQIQEGETVKFHALYRDQESDDIAVKSTTQYLNIAPNPIADTFSDLMDRDIDRSMGGIGQ